MSNEAITRLVVGDRYALSLGRPVEQRVRTNSTSALIWKNGEWVAAGALAGVARLMRPRRGGSTLRLQVGVKPIGAGRQPGRKWPMAVAVIALLFVTQVALAFISRAAPAMQIFAVGFAVTLGVGVFALVLTLPDTAREMLVQLSYVGHQVEMVASRMGRLP